MATEKKGANVSETIRSEAVDYTLNAYGEGAVAGVVTVIGDGGSFTGTTKIAAGRDPNGDASTFDTNPGNGTVNLDGTNTFSGELEVKAATIKTSDASAAVNLAGVNAKFGADLNDKLAVNISGKTSISKIDGTQVTLNGYGDNITTLADGTTLTTGTNVDAVLKAIESATVTLEGGAKVNSQNQVNLRTSTLTLTGAGTKLTTNEFAGATVDETSTLTIEDGAALEADKDIDNSGTVNVTNATLKTNTKITNSGTMTGSKAMLTGAIVNSGTLKGDYTGETVSVTNTSTGKAENVTLQAYGDKSVPKLAIVTVKGEAGSTFTGDTVIVAGYNTTADKDITDNDGTGSIKLDGENTFTGSLVMKGGSIGTSGSSAVLNLTDVDVRTNNSIGSSLTVYVSGESSLGQINGSSVEIDGTFNLEDNVILGAGTNISFEDFGGTLKINGNATLKDGAKIAVNDPSAALSTVEYKTLTLTGTDTALTVQSGFTNKGTIDVEAGATLNAYNGVTNTDATINLKGGTITGGTITGGTVNWVLDNSEYTASSLAWSVVSGATTKSITVDADAKVGDTYELATGFNGMTTFVLAGAGYDQNISVQAAGDTVAYAGRSYTMSVEAGNIVLTVAGPLSTASINEYAGGQSGQHTNDDAYTYYTNKDSVAAAAFDNPGADKGAVTYKWIVTDEWVGYENAKTQYDWEKATNLSSDGVALDTQKDNYNFIYLAGYDKDGNQVSMNIYQALRDTAAADVYEKLTNATGAYEVETWSTSEVKVTVDDEKTKDLLEGTASGIAAKYYSTDGGTNWTEITDGTVFATITEEMSGKDGKKDIQVKVVDKAGNEKVVTVGTVKVDTTEALLADIKVNGTIDGTTGWYNENSGTVTITGTATDATSGVAKVEYKINGGTWADAAGTESWTVTVGESATTAGDIYKFQVTDVAGNVSTAEYKTDALKVDQTDAVIVTVGTIKASEAAPTKGKDSKFPVNTQFNPDPETGWYNIATGNVAFTVTATDNLSGVASVEYTTDGGETVKTATYDKTKGYWTVVADETGKDSLTYQFRVTDVAGNVSDWGNDQTVKVDTIAPTMEGNAWNITAKNATDIAGDVTTMTDKAWVTNRAKGGTGAFTLGGTLAIKDDTGSKVTPSITITYFYQTWDSITNSWVGTEATYSKTYTYGVDAEVTYDAGTGVWALTTDLETVKNAAGTFKVTVSAKDEAGNVSTTDTFTGSFDNTMPSNPTVTLDKIYYKEGEESALKITAVDGTVGGTAAAGISQAGIQNRFWAATTGKLNLDTIFEKGQTGTRTFDEKTKSEIVITTANANEFWADSVTEGVMAEDAYNIAFYDQNKVGTYSSGKDSATEMSYSRFIVDRSAPIVSTVESAGAISAKDADGNDWYDDKGVTVSFDAIDAWKGTDVSEGYEDHVSGINKFYVKDGEEFVETTEVIKTITTAGENTYTFKADDKAGNVADPIEKTYRVDKGNVAYDGVAISGINGGDKALGGEGTVYLNAADLKDITGDATVKVTNVRDTYETGKDGGVGINRDIENTYYTIDGGPATVFDSKEANDFTSALQDLAEGTHTVVVHYEDNLVAAGTEAVENHTNEKTYTFMKDTVAATWTLAEGYTYTVDGGATGEYEGPATTQAVVAQLVQTAYEFDWSSNYSFTWDLADATSGLENYQAYTKNAKGEWIADGGPTPLSEDFNKISIAGNAGTADLEGAVEKKYVITDKAGNTSEFTATLKLDTTIDGTVKLVTKDVSTKLTEIGGVYYVTGDYVLEYAEAADGKSAANYVYTRTDGSGVWTQNKLTANAYTLDGAAADHKAVTYNAIVTDAAGNQKELGDVTVVKDTVGPEQTIRTGYTYTTDGGAAATSPYAPTTKDGTYATEGDVTTFADWSKDYSITVDFSDVTSGYDHYEVEWFLSTDGGQTFASQGTNESTDAYTVFGNSAADDGIWKNVVTTYDKAGNATTHTYIAKSDKTIDGTVTVKKGETTVTKNADGKYYVNATDYTLSYAMTDDKKSDATKLYYKESTDIDYANKDANADKLTWEAVEVSKTDGTTTTHNAIITDAAGNQTSLDALDVTVVVDTTPVKIALADGTGVYTALDSDALWTEGGLGTDPTAVKSQVVKDTTKGSELEDVYFTSKFVGYTFTVTDTNYLTSTVTLNGTYVFGTKIENGYSYTISDDNKIFKTEGANTLAVTASDKAGNVTEKTITIIYDNVAPTVSLAKVNGNENDFVGTAYSDRGNEAATGDAAIYLSDVSKVTFTIDAADLKKDGTAGTDAEVAGMAGVYYIVSTDGGTTWGNWTYVTPIDSQNGYEVTITADPTKTVEGIYRFAAVDYAGNASYTDYFTVEEDTTAPEQVEQLVRGQVAPTGDNYVEYTQDGQRINASDWVNTNQDKEVELNVTFNNETAKSDEKHFVTTKFDIAAYNKALADGKSKAEALAIGAEKAGGAWTEIGKTSGTTATQLTETYNVNEHSTYYFYSIDAAGNVSEYSVNEVKIDNIAPVFERVKETTDRGTTYTAFSVDVTDFGGSDVNADSLKIYNNSDEAVTFYLGGREVTLEKKGDSVAYVSGTKIEILKSVAKTDTFLFSVNDNAGNKTEETIGALSIEAVDLDGTALKSTELVWTNSAKATNGRALLNVTLEGISSEYFQRYGTLEYWDADQESFVELKRIYDDAAVLGFELPEGKYESLTLRATAGGATATRTYQAGVDHTDPTVETTMTFADGSTYDGSWTNKDVTVKADYTDALSGIAGRSWDDKVISAESATAAGTTVDFETRDVAGNKGSGSATVKIDKTAATIATDTNGYAAGTWTNKTVVIGATATDNLSGFGANEVLEKKLDDQTFATDGKRTATFDISDNAGNAAETATVEVKVDKTKAEITTDTNGYAAGTWTNQTVVIGATATDNLSGFGANEVLEKKLDDQTFATDGKYTATFDISDNAGNAAETATVEVKVDKTKATIAATAKTADGEEYVAGTWTNQDVTVSATATDNLSGFDANETLVKKLDDQTFDATGTATFSGKEAVDQAGNVAADVTFEVNIDKIAPTVTVSQDPETLTKGSVTVTAKFADEGGSQVAYGEYSFDQEIWLTYENPLTITENTLIYFRAFDNAGNESETVVQDVWNIYEDERLVLDGREITLSTGSYALDSIVLLNGSSLTVTGAASMTAEAIEIKSDDNVIVGVITAAAKNYKGTSLTIAEDAKLTVGEKQMDEFQKRKTIAVQGTLAVDGAVDATDLKWSIKSGVANLAANDVSAQTVAFNNAKVAQTVTANTWTGIAKKTDSITTSAKTDVTIDAAIDLADKADKITVGADAQFSALGTVDFGADTDTLTIGARSTAAFGAVTNLEKLTVTAGKAATKTAEAVLTTATFQSLGASDTLANTITLGNYTDTDVDSGVIFGAKNDTVSLGNYANAEFDGDLAFAAGNDTVRIGSDSTFASGALDFGDTTEKKSTDKLTVGARSTAAVGDITGVNTITLTAGKAATKAAEQVDTKLEAGAVTMLASKADTVTIGNYATFDVDSLATGDLADKLTIGNYDTVDLGDVDLGAGNDTVKIGTNSTVTAGKLDFGEGKDSLNIGAGSTLSVDTLDNLETLTMSKTKGKESILCIADADSYAAAQEKWGKTYGSQIVQTLA